LTRYFRNFIFVTRDRNFFPTSKKNLGRLRSFSVPCFCRSLFYAYVRHLGVVFNSRPRGEQLHRRASPGHRRGRCTPPGTERRTALRCPVPGSFSCVRCLSLLGGGHPLRSSPSLLRVSQSSRSRASSATSASAPCTPGSSRRSLVTGWQCSAPVLQAPIGAHPGTCARTAPIAGAAALVIFSLAFGDVSIKQ
jgi:hypothetical protein